MDNNDLVRQKLLIEILLDRNADDAERDDAAMDLAEYYTDEFLNALMQAAIVSKQDDFFLDSCGESIGRLWVKNDRFDLNVYKSFQKWAQMGVYNELKLLKPDWIIEYNLENPFKGISKKDKKKHYY